MRTSHRLILSLLAATLAASLAPARAALFGDDEARKAILELRDGLAESDRQQRERTDALSKRIEALENRICRHHIDAKRPADVPAGGRVWMARGQP